MRAIDMSETRSYPRRLPTEAGDIEFPLMTRADEAAVLDFAEALLREHVKNAEGRKHDIVVLGHNVAHVRAQLEANSLPGAVSSA
jgi:hypothetical protein